MSYAVCIEAAGVPVLSYHEDGDYQGRWFAYTAAGFYSGGYGSCSGCDWREAELVNADDRDGETCRAIDAGIGREILKDAPMTKEQLIAGLAQMYVSDDEEVRKWIDKCVP